MASFLQNFILMKGLLAIPSFKKKKYVHPWPMWFSWLVVVLKTKRLLVGFRVRAHAWVVSSVPGGSMRGNQSMFLSLCFSLPSLSLKEINKIFKKKKQNVQHWGLGYCLVSEQNYLYQHMLCKMLRIFVPETKTT